MTTMNKLLAFGAKVTEFNKRVGDWAIEGGKLQAEREALMAEAKTDLGLPMRVSSPMLGQIKLDVLLPDPEKVAPPAEQSDDQAA